MLKKIYLSALSLILILALIYIFLSTVGIKTNKFNNLLNEKVSEINPKITLKLNDVNFKLDPTNFEFQAQTDDPIVAINNKEIELELIKFDLNIFEYLKDNNPVSKLSIVSKENNIKKFTDFINEYDFNLTRNLILKQIKKGKLKIFSDITFDEKNPNKMKYSIEGYVKDAKFKFFNQPEIENIKFDFTLGQNIINLKKIELSIDKILFRSKEININRGDNQFKISGNFKTNRSKIDINKYINIINTDIDLLNDQLIYASSNNRFSFNIDNNLKIKDLRINSELNFDELHTNSKYQNLIYLKNGNLLINYDKKKLEINLNSKFLFKNTNYNNKDSKNLIKAIYKKKPNNNASVDIDLSNSYNKINTNEFKKFISLDNFSLPKQDINFSSTNKINFELNKNFKVKNFNSKSEIKIDDVLIDYKSQRIKKYFNNFKNQIKLSNSYISFDYKTNKFKIGLKSKYSINDTYEIITLGIKRSEKDYFFDLDINLDSSEINIDELNYKKKSDIKSNLSIKGIYKNNNEINFDNIIFNEEEKKIHIQNLEIGRNDKIKNLDLFKIDLVNKFGKKNDLEFKKINDKYYLSGNEFDGAENIKNLIDNSSESIFTNFKNLNTSINLNFGKYYVNEDSYLANLQGEIKVKNNKVFYSDISAKLNNKEKFKLSIFTADNKQKITKLEIDQPEPFIKHFKFIKGFKEGSLQYESSELDGKTVSYLKITDFKVQEVPVLAKLLTLASLQGIADVLTGEGIRFADFEMDYETLGNTTNIKEIYAIGPAISLMMQGYVVKDNLTSLKGTLVPATTINKTISKIPMLGEILVGKKIGEGVFGVSFKIKGPPKKLKTTVNPIKTLTPRFITRTLEKISN